jgi:ATP-dependent DNA helicase RecG
METTDDGFRLAEEDLRLRGPGEYFGTRQSGLPDLRVARLSDIGIIEQARAEATRLLEADPDLDRPEHRQLADAVRPLWDSGSAEAAALAT